jgi:hypothetical protein
MQPEPKRDGDLAYWMGRVDTTLTALTTATAALKLAVEVGLEGVNKVLLDHATRIAKLEGARNARKGSNPSTIKEDVDGKNVTWKWIVDRLFGPLITAVLVFLIIEVFPKIFAHLGGAP